MPTPRRLRTTGPQPRRYRLECPRTRRAPPGLNLNPNANGCPCQGFVSLIITLGILSINQLTLSPTLGLHLFDATAHCSNESQGFASSAQMVAAKHRSIRATRRGGAKINAGIAAARILGPPPSHLTPKASDGRQVPVISGTWIQIRTNWSSSLDRLMLRQAHASTGSA